MNGFSICRFNGIFYTFANGRMRMKAVKDFVISGFQFSSHNGFNDDFGNVVSDHMGTEPFSIFCIEDHFDETFGMSGGRSFSGCT